MNELSEIKKSFLADCVIDQAEVTKLRELLYADGKINREKAGFLFELNDAVSGKFNHSSWEAFFVEAITGFLLENEGEVSDEDAEWLLSKIKGDKQLDKAEKALLANVKMKAKKLPAVLNSKFMFLNLLQ